VYSYFAVAKKIIIMQQPDKIASRKKFLVWGTAVLTSLTVFKLFTGSKKTTRSNNEEGKETVKMLSQDGTLVEIEVEKFFCGKRKKISDEQLKNWINKK
jgi:hypothetical protein